jgi:hypothetical protein
VDFFNRQDAKYAKGFVQDAKALSWRFLGKLGELCVLGGSIL